MEIYYLWYQTGKREISPMRTQMAIVSGHFLLDVWDRK